jgi:hypothetical protein
MLRLFDHRRLEGLRQAKVEALKGPQMSRSSKSNRTAAAGSAWKRQACSRTSPKAMQERLQSRIAHRRGEIRVFNAAGELEKTIRFDEQAAQQRV